MSTEKLNSYVEKFYDFDELVRSKFQEDIIDDYESRIYSGSLAEGAFLTPLMIPVENKNYDT